MDEEHRFKRLKYRSAHRGCKETDLILGNFADERLKQLDAAQVDMYERLLDEDDADIWAWLTGKADFKPEYGFLIETLKAYGLPRD